MSLDMGSTYSTSSHKEEGISTQHSGQNWGGQAEIASWEGVIYIITGFKDSF